MGVGAPPRLRRRHRRLVRLERREPLLAAEDRHSLGRREPLLATEDSELLDRREPLLTTEDTSSALARAEGKRLMLFG
jgi:hypothetical protein